MKTIAIVCQKGGVGKSTTALNFGAGLAHSGKKVLFIDLDAQGNLTDTLCCIAENTVFDVLTGSLTAAEATQKVALGHLLAAGSGLSGADISVSGNRSEYRLQEALALVKAEYDYVIIDTPPTLGILTVNALTAADEVIITTQADIYSLRAIGQLALTVDAVQKHCNAALVIKGILLTRFSPRSILSRDMAEMIEQTAEVLHTKLFTSTIREAVAIKESQACQQDIFTYMPKSAVAQDYQDLINEYVAR